MSKIPDLTEEQKSQVTETLRYWASVHPYPDREIGAVGPHIITPRKMAEAAAAPETEMGRSIHHLFAVGIAHMPWDGEASPTLDEMLADFRKDADRWAAKKKPAAKRPGGPSL